MRYRLNLISLCPSLFFVSPWQVFPNGLFTTETQRQQEAAQSKIAN